MRNIQMYQGNVLFSGREWKTGKGQECGKGIQGEVAGKNLYRVAVSGEGSPQKPQDPGREEQDDGTLQEPQNTAAHFIQPPESRQAEDQLQAAY